MQQHCFSLTTTFLKYGEQVRARQKAVSMVMSVKYSAYSDSLHL